MEEKESFHVNLLTDWNYEFSKGSMDHNLGPREASDPDEPLQDGPLIPELSFGFYSDRTDIFTNDQTVIEKTKRRYLVQDGYPQNLITEYNISNKFLHFNETHKIRDPKHLPEGISFRKTIGTGPWTIRYRAPQA